MSGEYLYYVFLSIGLILSFIAVPSSARLYQFYFGAQRAFKLHVPTYIGFWLLIVMIEFFVFAAFYPGDTSTSVLFNIIIISSNLGAILIGGIWAVYSLLAPDNKK